MNRDPSRQPSNSDDDGGAGSKAGQEPPTRPHPAIRIPHGDLSGNGAAHKKLLEKVRRFEGSKEVRSLGIYPYFRCIQSCQNPEVIIDGQPFIMMGSNNYLGLVSDPRVIEAARAAAQRYG